jgi:hypothetical protein
MGFSRFLPGLMEAIVSFAQSNTIIAIIIALILLTFLFRRPKLFFGLLSLALILALLFHIIGNLAGSGSERKKSLMEQTESGSQ